MFLSDLDIVEVRCRLDGGGLSTRELVGVDFGGCGLVFSLPHITLSNKSRDQIVLLQYYHFELVLVIFLARTAADGGLSILLSFPRLLILIWVLEVVKFTSTVDDLGVDVLALLASKIGYVAVVKCGVELFRAHN